MGITQEQYEIIGKLVVQMSVEYSLGNNAEGGFLMDILQDYVESLVVEEN